MKARVDREACIGCGLCAAICPEVFEMDDEGKAVVVDADFSEGQLRDAKDTGKQCPVGAIIVE